MTFRIEGQPPRTTAQQKGLNTKGEKPVWYTKAKVQRAKNWYLYNLMRNRPKKPIEGAVYLKTVWTFTTTKRKLFGKWKTTKPDTENMLKLLKDCMTKAGFWKDDAQVAYEITAKKWGDDPGIEISVIELGDDAFEEF